MKNDIYRAIAIFWEPVIIGVKPSASTDIQYDGNGGHSLTVYKCNSDKDNVWVCDPWAGYVHEYDKSRYSLPTTSLYNGYNAINCGYAY